MRLLLTLFSALLFIPTAYAGTLASNLTVGFMEVATGATLTTCDASACWNVTANGSSTGGTIIYGTIDATALATSSTIFKQTHNFFRTSSAGKITMTGTGKLLITGTGSSNASPYDLTVNNTSTLKDVSLESGLKGYFRMDDGTGSTVVRDSSRYGNTGTWNGAGAGNAYPQWKTSNGGTNFFNPYSLSFDGTDDYVGTGTWTNYGEDNFTISAWINATDTSGVKVIFDQDGAALPYVTMFVTAAGLLSLDIRNTGGGGAGAASTTNVEGAWHHVVALRSGVDIRVYNRALTLGEVQSLSNGNQSTGSGVYILGSALDLRGELALYYSTLDVTSGNLKITASGGWIGNGGFTAQSGTVEIDGSTATMSGNTIFNSFTANTTNSILLDFRARQSFSGALTLTNTTLRSTLTGSASNILLDGSAGTQTVTGVNVQDNDASGGTTISCSSGCTEGTNVTNWSFAAAVEELNSVIDYFFSMP